MKIFKSLAAIVSAILISFTASAEPPTNVAGLIGNWVNIDSSTGGIVRVVITNTGSGLRFTSYGACSPTPCVHSTVVAYPYAASVASETATAFYAYRYVGFKYERHLGQRIGSYLRLDSLNTFASGDTRTDYHSYGYFLKQ